MKFAADEMLGKLAKWLRIVGCDVFYNNRITDQELISLCRAQHRILLTRDTPLLAETKDLPSLFIVSDYFREQLQQVLEAFHIDPCQRAFSRCVLCNQELVEEKRELVKDQVPPYIFETQEEFWRCPDCQRIYWPGTHHERMIKELKSLISQENMR